LPAALAAVGEMREPSPGSYEVRVAEASRVPELAEAVLQHGGRLHAMVPRRETLEDFFIRTVTGAEEGEG
jgi:hypothetical protein